MDFINESESEFDNKKASRTKISNMVVPKKRSRYTKDVTYRETTPDTDPESPGVRSDTDPESPSVQSDTDPESPGVRSDISESPSNCIPRLSDPENPIKELPTSDNQTTDSPQDSGELAFRPAIESPDGAEANLPESLKEDSIADAPENSTTPEMFDYSTRPDVKRSRRISRRRNEVGKCCPVCGITVRFHELESHLAQEIEKLSTIPRRPRNTSRNDNGINTTYVQVKSNRENRLIAKVARYTARTQKETQCPVCKIRMTGSVEEMNEHVVGCLQTNDYVNVDDEDDSSYEEFEIGDETRIRAISLIPGGYRSFQGQTVQSTQEDDLEVEVDIDDTMTYGQPQYTELDVLSLHSRNEADEQLRKSVLVDPTVQPIVLESRKWSKNAGVTEENKVTESRTNQLEIKQEKNNGSVTEEEKPSNSVISALKDMIKDLDKKDDVKCLICLEPYTKPVVSVTCWHVHCEECWLMTMGVKKLCPQCNMIVFPGDLRKIYL